MGVRRTVAAKVVTDLLSSLTADPVFPELGIRFVVVGVVVRGLDLSRWVGVYRARIMVADSREDKAKRRPHAVVDVCDIVHNLGITSTPLQAFTY